MARLNPDTQELEQAITGALESVFMSPNETDSNFEAANVVDGLYMIGRAIYRLGKAVDRLADAQGAPPKVD